MHQVWGYFHAITRTALPTVALMTLCEFEPGG